MPKEKLYYINYFFNESIYHMDGNMIHMVNTFVIIFLNQKVGFILNLICKVSLSILPTIFSTTKKKEKKSTNDVKRIKINLDFIFNNFPVHCTGLRLVTII